MTQPALQRDGDNDHAFKTRTSRNRDQHHLRWSYSKFILHGAANSEEDAATLRTENLRLIRARQRPDRGV